MSFGRDTIRRCLFPDQSEVDQGPQGVASLAAQLELHSRLSLPASLLFLLISVKAHKLGKRLACRRDTQFNHGFCNSILVMKTRCSKSRKDKV